MSKNVVYKVTASNVREGDYLPGLGMGYVFTEPETGNGYLSYPSTSYGMDTAMPDDTVLIMFHDADGEECYLILPPDSVVEVSRA